MLGAEITASAAPKVIPEKSKPRNVILFTPLASVKIGAFAVKVENVAVLIRAALVPHAVAASITKAGLFAHSVGLFKP